jgi:zinc protease
MKQISSFILFLAVMLSSGLHAQVDRSKAPAPGPAPAIQIGKYETKTLDNGLRVIVVENHKLPQVSWSIRLDRDPILEGAKAGYVGMAGNLMGSGTETLTKSQIDEKADFIGASLSTDSEGIFASSLTKHTDKLLTLVSDVLLHPSFPEAEIEKYRKQAISGLAAEKTDPNSISDRISSQVKYGKKHPYGESGTEESLKNITRDDLVNYYQTYFKPNIAYLIVVGDITPDKAFALAQQYFGEWKSGDVPQHQYPNPIAPKGNVVAFVPVPGAVQSVIDVTYPVNLQPGTLDAIQASVLNNILGGSGFQSRLMQNLREDKAFTYGCYSSISPDEVIGSFSAGCSVRNEVTDSSVTEILFEMQRLVNDAVDNESLQVIKNIMTGSFARSLERPQTVANFAYNIEKYKLPKDYYETYLQKLNAITPEDVKAIAQRLLRPSNAYITVVGNRETAATLKKFAASGNVDMYQPDGSPLVELKAAPAGVTAATVLAAYVKAIGGEKAIKKVKSYELKGKMDMGMMAIEMNKKVVCGKPGKSLMVMNAMGMEVVKQVYDGASMTMYQMGQKTPVEESDAFRSKLDTDLTAEMNYASYGVQSVLKGIEPMQGKEYYVVEHTMPGGLKSTDYFDVSTGLRYKTVDVSEEDGVVSLTEIVYKEYMTTKAKVMFPKVTTINADGQSFDMVTNEVVINAKIDASLFQVQ